MNDLMSGIVNMQKRYLDIITAIIRNTSFINF